MLIEQTDDERVRWRAEKLKDAGSYAIANCRVKVDKTRLRQARKKIESIYLDKTEFDVVLMLSFILCGVQELLHFNKEGKSLSLLEKRLLWFLKYFDPKLTQENKHQQAYERYVEWAEN